MSNHLHLALGTTGQHQLQDIIRDFKKIYFSRFGTGDCCQRAGKPQSLAAGNI